MAKKHVFLLLSILFSLTYAQAEPIQVTSPDGKQVIIFDIKSGQPVYRFDYQKQPILSDSPLGVVINTPSEEVKNENWTVESVANTSHDSTWKPIHGFKDVYPDRYNDTIIALKSESQKMKIEFRVFNEGAAFRYILPVNSDFNIRSEKTQFVFPENYLCCYTSNPQDAYDLRPLSKAAHTPPGLIVEIQKNKLYAAIAEAGSLEQYAPMILNPVAKKPGTLQADFRKGTVSVLKTNGSKTANDSQITFSTPWRVIMAAENPGRFIEQAYILQNLNDPCAIKDTSFITVGKVWRNTSSQRPNSDKIVDYNAANNYQFVHWDTGWNGNEYDKIPDHPTQIDGNRDLLGAIKYAHDHGQKFFLYCNHRELENYSLDDTFRTYKKWGVDGVKFGFVNYESQADMEWLHKAIKKAADYQLMVNVHDNYRPTGWERTYPNLVSVEGIAGNECNNCPSATPKSRTIMAFGRQVNGMGDFTPCFLNPRVKSRAFQLACAVVFFNPLQYIHWYDAPLDPNQTQYPELKFWSDMPTVWDDTKVLSGEPGEFIAIARRKGTVWFVSVITDKPREISIPLSFITDRKPTDKLDLTLYKENPQNTLECKVEHRTACTTDSIPAVMGQEGGFNMVIR